MKKYAKIVNDKTKLCEVGIGTNIQFYQSIGMTEQDVEEAWNDAWYLAGYAPQKPQEIKEQEVRIVRNQYLAETDKYMIIDFPISDEEREEYKGYRQYLRDYTKEPDWFEKNPMTFDEWKQVIIDSSDIDENGIKE